MADYLDFLSKKWARSYEKVQRAPRFTVKP
jgi:hypothetical protein